MIDHQPIIDFLDAMLKLEPEGRLQGQAYAAEGIYRFDIKEGVATYIFRKHSQKILASTATFRPNSR